MDSDRCEDALSSNPSPCSRWVRFFDVFLQEKNIKWILGLGGLILLASSLMLVTSHWSDFTPLWKSSVVMLYTAGLFFIGDLAYRRLGLRRTGTGLWALTVLLIPVTFLAMHWARADAELINQNLPQTAGLALLLFVQTAFSWVAARRIFGQFLRADQPTFLGSYLTLSIAGAIVPALPLALAPLTALVLWIVFVLGTVKVNRHVFWLGEEHRLPRIFGFFPILLLGTQFLILFAFLAPHLPLPWMGFACVLVAIPVLLTADALARVFVERTGNLIRPLPYSLVIPLLAGLGLTIAGNCLAWTSYPRAYATLPTGILTTAIFALIARRTQRAGFVWGTWGSILLVYQSLPTFFHELTQAVLRQGADAVSEPRLPLAFYGLTYLPLILVATVVAFVAQRRGNNLIAQPTRRFVIGFTSLLWAVSFTHEKAIFPVGVATLLTFFLQKYLFRTPSLRFGILAAWISTSWGLTPFLSHVLFWNLAPGTRLFVMSLSAGLLLGPGRLNAIRSRFQRYESPIVSLTPIYEVASLILTLLFCACWIIEWNEDPINGMAWRSGLILCSLTLLHAWHWCCPGLSGFALIFTGFCGVLWADGPGVHWNVIISAGTLVAVSLWAVSIGLEKIPATRFALAFRVATKQIGGGTLVVIILGYYLPALISGMQSGQLKYWWLSVLVSIVWLFDAARRWQSATWTHLGCLGTLAVTGALTSQLIGPNLAFTWIAVVWASLGLIIIPVLSRSIHWEDHEDEDSIIKRSSSTKTSYVIEPGSQFLTLLFAILAVATLPIFTLAIRLAGIISLAGLLLLGGRWKSRNLQQASLILLNWHVLSGLVPLVAPGLSNIAEINKSALLLLSLPLAAGAAISRFFWQPSAAPKGSTLSELVSFQRLALLGIVSFGLVFSLELITLGLPPGYELLAFIVFLMLGLDQIRQAVRTNDEIHVWTAEVLAAMTVGYFILCDVIQFGSGLSTYAILLTGWVLWSLGHLAASSNRWRILSQPFMLTGFALPALAVAIGVGRHFLIPNSLWLGMNSLALLFAAGFYFWRGLEEQRKSCLLLAAGILNVALALLWRELQWHDPQLFAIPLGISILALVQILKNEIPEKAHDPLRYLGALVILVSPVFHVVSGSWLHLITLMIASVLITLTAMGLRIRALMYTGTAFLLGDLLAMVVRGSIDRPTLLWMAGIAVGMAVVALAAYCEKHREQVLQRLRIMAAELESWD